MHYVPKHMLLTSHFEIPYNRLDQMELDQIKQHTVFDKSKSDTVKRESKVEISLKNIKSAN